MLRFGLFGAGRIGRVHAASLAAHPQTELAVVHDPGRIHGSVTTVERLHHQAVQVTAAPERDGVLDRQPGQLVPEDQAARFRRDHSGTERFVERRTLFAD